jgi:NTE family protein
MEISKYSVGLVLSGGGSKGIAQAGVLQFLEEQNIKPSQLAGTSAGSIIAALYSFGKTPQEILEFFKSIYFFSWRHFTFKKAGLIDSESFRNYFIQQLGDVTVGELNIPVHITATDMVKGKLKIFEGNTKVVDAIIASCAFPGLLSPYEIDGNLYSDGGILNHFPTDILQGRCETLIVPFKKLKPKICTPSNR